MAQEVEVSLNGQGKGSITIQNAAKGETYKLYRLFDATVSATVQGNGSANSIAYTGSIPEELKNYFEADENGYITATEAAWTPNNDIKEMSPELQKALETWTESATAVAVAESDGSQLKFINLEFFYYEQ